MAAFPTVSVCVPMYNGAAYLPQCLDSVLAQTFADFEVILVDDGSTDDTLAIAQRYAAQDSRFRVAVNGRNRGLIGNWNRCVELARAPWIKYVFQDDLLRPDGLARLLDAATCANVPLSFGRRGFVFEPGTSAESVTFYEQGALRVAELFPIDGQTGASDFARLVLANLRWNIVGEPVAVLLRRDVFDAVGLFHPDVAVLCDMEFWARAGSRFGVAHTTETVADFRVHGESTTARTMSGDHFRLYALDHLVFHHDMAFSPVYAPLREAAALDGFDVAGRFSATALWAQGWAVDLANGPERQRKPLDDLQRLQARLPQLNKVLARARRRHELGQLVGRVKRAFGGGVP